MKRNPVRFHLVIAFGLAASAAVALWWLVSGRNTVPIWLACWLTSINLVTFGYYGYDKRCAVVGGRRVPEWVLHALSTGGGSPAAFLAMHLFRHKTIKGAFRILFWCIVVLQAGLIAWLLKAHWFG